MPDAYRVFDDAHADKEKQRLAEEEERRFREELADAWDWLLSDDRGLLLMWFVLSRCGALQSSFNTQSTVMAFNEGRRSVGNFILNSMLERDCNALIRMIKRYDDARRERDGN